MFIHVLRTSVNIAALHLGADNVDRLSPGHRDNIGKLVTAAVHVRHLIVYGEHDSRAFKHQSESYASSLKYHHLQNITTLEIKAADHFNLVEDLRNPEYILSKEIIEFISH